MFNPNKNEVDKHIQDLHGGLISVNYEALNNHQNEQRLYELRNSIDIYLIVKDFMILPDPIFINNVYRGFPDAFMSGILTRTNQVSNDRNRLLFPNIYQTQINVLSNYNIDIDQTIIFNQLKDKIENDNDIDTEDKSRLVDAIKEIETLKDKVDRISAIKKSVKRIIECSDKTLSKPYVIKALAWILANLGPILGVQ